MVSNRTATMLWVGENKFLQDRGIFKSEKLHDSFNLARNILISMHKPLFVKSLIKLRQRNGVK